MLEEWRPIEEFPDYIVSTLGRVHNGRTRRPVGISLVTNIIPMPTVALQKDLKQYRRSLARLVAVTFLEQPHEHFNTPINLDGDRLNCRVDNLAWRPRWFAIRYHMERAEQAFAQWTRAIRLDQTWEVFSHISEPAIKYGLLERDIHKSLVEGTAVFPHNYTFRYFD